MLSNKILSLLDELEIAHQTYEHPAFDTCEVSATFHKEQSFKGQRAKNLFLRNKNGKQHFLVVLPHEKNFDKVEFRELSGQKCSFASDERLAKHLGVKPGHVSPLALVNDEDKAVQIYLDADLMSCELIHLHPGINTMSSAIRPEDLIKFLKHLDYEPTLHSF